MAQKTDLNVAPYYDDFTETDNYVRTLFRPGFAVQARELTQLQSVLQNQVEKFGSHVFKEGAMVIPGQTSLLLDYHSLKLESTFGTETIDISQYYNETTPVTITGATTGVTAQIVGFDAATTTDQPTLYMRYTNTGTDNVTSIFADGENISADISVTHTSSYSADVVSATTYTSEFNPETATTASLESSTGPAARTGSAVNIQAGVFFIRGFFVTCTEQTLVLDKYGNNPSYRVGLSITEGLLTSDDDSTLLDNATGSSNFAASGAHRLKFTLTLAKIARDATTDDSFVELLDTHVGTIMSQVRSTEYSVLGQTLARRTYDESGDYTVRPFQFQVLESVTTNLDTGIYTKNATTDDGATATTDLLAVKVSPGKAYVGGYEIEKVGPTYKDITKARTFSTLNAGVSTFEMGNYVFIENVYNTPDITSVSGETTPFKLIELYDSPIATRGSAAGSLVAIARARSIEYYSGTAGASSSNNDSQYKLYLFDLKPITRLELSERPSISLTANHSNGGVQVTDATSGATGFVYASGTSGNTCLLTNVTGSFSAGSNLTVSDRSGNLGVTITNVINYAFRDVASVYMSDPDTGQDFTADVVATQAAGLAGSITMNGTDANGANANDNILLDASAVNVDEFGEIELESGLATKQPKLQDAEKNSSLEKLSRRAVKTLLTTTNNGLTDTQYTIRRQFVGTTNSAGVVSFNAGANETFVSHAEKDYTVSVLTAGGGSSVGGDLISIASTMSGGGTTTLTITDSTLLGNAAKVKVLATILKTSVNHKIKTTQLMKQVKVTSGTSDAYGTRPTDATISLGRADSFRLVGVFDSESTTTDAVAPTLTTGATTATFTRGEKITGASSGATGRLITTSSPFQYVLTGSGTFIDTETITGESSGATAVISSQTEGDKVITGSYALDTGQRDNYYDIARIVRKPIATSPTGRLLIVHDYFEHGAGDLLTVDSYSDIASQMTYADIPTYSATKIDPDDPAPQSEFPLTDTLDFRPRVEDITGASTTLATVDEITGNSFDFFHRQFDGSGASLVDFPKPGSSVQADFEFYLGKKVNIAMGMNGQIIVTEGIPAERPEQPVPPENAMQLCVLDIPPFTFRPEHVSTKRTKNQRFTMKDIGALEKRIDTIEYFTSLNLLERSAESFEVTDANGLNRFKSGFVVDNFSGHRVGDTVNKDYNISMDMENNEARPMYKSRGIYLAENVSTDNARASAGYKKTGDLITLPYTEEVFTEQPYATRVERVTPFLVSSWVGSLSINPNSDEWFETEIAPQLIVNVEGNFDATVNRLGNQIGTVWNAWETQWTGVVNTRWEMGDAWAAGNREDGDRFRRQRRTIEGTATRTGVNTQVLVQTDRESQGFRVINRALIPFMRSRAIEFTGFNFRPKCRLHAFFDKTNVNAFITPKSSDYAPNIASPTMGDSLISNGIGKVEGTFTIPDPKVSGNPKFETGEALFRLSSSSSNSTDWDGSTNTLADNVFTMGEAIFTSKGILETEQETIIATRNATVVRTQMSQTEARTTEEVGGWEVFDPLAQTFIVEALDDDTDSTGRFVTSVDLYFFEKDDSFPVTVELRNVVNGYPGAKILPFGSVTLEPSEINLSATAATATRFTFPSPVYVKNGVEYTIAVITKVPTYKAWIARMGEKDIGGARTVSTQAHIGVLFKSHNNRAWAMSPMEDLKFKINVAKFDTSGAGGVELVNEALPAALLKPNPCIIEHGSTVVKVKHSDHGMYNVVNNVTIDKVKSGASTTLSASIGAADTTLTLASGGNFDDTSGKYSVCANGLYYIKIGDEILSYTTISDTAVSGVTRGVNSTTATSHTGGATVELYNIHKVPLQEINKTHTSIANIGIDHYTISISTSPVVGSSGDSSEVGGVVATATENAMMDQMSTIVSTLELPATSITGEVRPTTATSVAGSQSSFSKTAAASALPFRINDSYIFDDPYMVASGINETNEMSGVKSFQMSMKMFTKSSTVSPVIDLKRSSLITIGNRINNVDSSSDVYPTSLYKDSTEPEGDGNAAIYITKQINLENPASALKVLFTAYRPPTADIKVLFKILKTNDSTDFDDLGYNFFNSTGVPDQTVGPSLTKDNYREYVYTAGVTDEGIGVPLDEFIGFSVKIVLQCTNSANVPKLKEFRALAMVN